MTLRRDIVVGVAAHKPYRMPADPAYLPLHVGAALHPGLDLGPEFQRDDEGDSISTRNASYSELTGLYWLWKNVDAEAKGLVHYRRLLGSPDRARLRASDPYERLATGNELRELLRQVPVVVAKRRNYYIETVYAHYAHTFEGEQFDACRAALADRWSEYAPAWDRFSSSCAARTRCAAAWPLRGRRACRRRERRGRWADAAHASVLLPAYVTLKCSGRCVDSRYTEPRLLREDVLCLRPLPCWTGIP